MPFQPSPTGGRHAGRRPTRPRRRVPSCWRGTWTPPWPSRRCGPAGRRCSAAPRRRSRCSRWSSPTTGHRTRDGRASLRRRSASRTPGGGTGGIRFGVMVSHCDPVFSAGCPRLLSSVKELVGEDGLAGRRRRGCRAVEDDVVADGVGPEIGVRCAPLRRCALVQPAPSTDRQRGHRKRGGYVARQRSSRACPEVALDLPIPTWRHASLTRPEALEGPTCRRARRCPHAVTGASPHPLGAPPSQLRLNGGHDVADMSSHATRPSGR